MKQTTLFGTFLPSTTKQTAQMPRGLIVVENFITKEEESELMKNIYEYEWSDQLKRRVQQYGYNYSYTKRNLSQDDLADEIPTFLQPLSENLKHYFNGKMPEQLIINEYTPGQGINPHTDAKVFGDPIISLSLGSSCEFLFSHPNGEQYSLFLKPRTLVVMSGESRYIWKHSIPNKKADIDSSDNIVKRGTRVSLTFRILA